MKQNKERQEGTFPWQFLFGSMAAYGAVKFFKALVSWIAQLRALRKASSVGIIDGADGSTSVFVSSRLSGEHITSALSMLLGIGGFLLLNRKEKK